MKNNSLDDIVKISIEISSPAQNMETFDTILMIVRERNRAAAWIGQQQYQQRTNFPAMGIQQRRMRIRLP